MLFVFFSLPRRPPRSTLFPYTTLFRSRGYCPFPVSVTKLASEMVEAIEEKSAHVVAVSAMPPAAVAHSRDRKSTRLNSSHSSISYAVFCLKKKKKKENNNKSVH